MRWNLRQRGVLLIVTGGVVAGCVTAALWSNSIAAEEPAGKPPSAVQATDVMAIASEIDRQIEAELAASSVKPAGLVNDEDFLRRVSFDIAGTLPTAKEVTLFGLDPDADKRAKLIDRLLASDDYALNWATYWRDVIFLRATNEFARVAIPTFESWMTTQLQQNVGWNKIAQSLITGVGEVSEHGEAALMFAQQGNAEEIAGEASRIFLGIQLQCANCHDHPTDKWTRDQFHALAAFFPRISIQRGQAMPPTFTVASFNAQGGGRSFQQILQEADFIVRRFDTNNDGKLSKAEAAGSALERPFDRLLEFGDDNRDGLLTAKELKSMPIPEMPGRGNAEHYMSDLTQPTDKGKLMTPAFFVTNAKGRTGMEDEDRRALFAKFATSPTNPWFAKSFVNRIWGELLGEGFYMPIDDMGPERKARMGSVLDYLASEFVKHDHDIQWLIRTITNTRTYQRQVRFNEPTENPVPFASAIPTRLRADQLMNAVIKVLGVDEGPRHSAGPAQRGRRTPREQVEMLFGFDPSTPQDELLGNVPQALFMMNLPQISNALKAEGNTRLGQILANNKTDKAAISELYLAFFARDPSDKELTIAVDYLEKVGNRREAFEDLAWSLLNSSEFLSKR